jgi:hypothetical protein
MAKAFTLFVCEIWSAVLQAIPSRKLFVHSRLFWNETEKAISTRTFIERNVNVRKNAVERPKIIFHHNKEGNSML